MAQLMIVLGNVEDAVRISEGAIRQAKCLGDFGSLAFTLGLSLFVLAMCGRVEATLHRAEAFEANASEKGARLWVSIAREWASWDRGLLAGDAAAAANKFRDIMAARREQQEGQSAYVGHGLLAQLQGKAGAFDDALVSIAEGLALASKLAATARIRSSTGSGATSSLSANPPPVKPPTTKPSASHRAGARAASSRPRMRWRSF